MKFLRFYIIFVNSICVFCTYISQDPVQPLCLSYSTNLASAASKFIQCSVNYSRPMSICKNCLKYYLIYKENFDLMSKDDNRYAKTLYPNGLKCIDIVEAADRIQINYHIYSMIDSIWSTSNCEKCFESYQFENNTTNFTLNKDVVIFYEKYRILENCIANFTNVISFDPIFDDFTPNCSLCNNCKEHYLNLSSFYRKMGDETTICMDVVSTLNLTRIMWSNGYKCNYRNADTLDVYLISGSFIIGTILFYIILRLCGEKQERTFAMIFRRIPSRTNQT